MKSTTLLVLTLISLVFVTSARAELQKGTSNGGAALGCVPSEFRLGPDDVIEISVYQEKDLDVTVPVRPDGMISIRLIGEMPASGKTARELEKEIATRYSRFYAEPSVTVVVKEVNSPKVSVMGEVKTPGSYKIKDRADILDAIALAGGLTEYAKRDKIMVIRFGSSGTDRQTLKVNYNDYVKGKRSDPFCVLPYDKIVVE